MTSQPKIAFLGAGNMSRALISGLIAQGYPATAITVTNRSPEKLAQLNGQLGIKTTQDNAAAVNANEIIILAVKPQQMAELLTDIRSTAVSFANKLVISIAAGINCQRLMEMAGESLTLVRAMPNTPSLLGVGMTGLYAEESLPKSQRIQAEAIFAAVGKVLWVKHENEINHVIAAAGSAPAYLFLFLEAIATEAERLGFTPAEARLLVEQTALGAAAMVAGCPEKPISTLREEVTSKGGATFAALEVFRQGELAPLTARAMQAAIARAQEMEQLF